MTPRVKPGAQGEDISATGNFSWALGYNQGASNMWIDFRILGKVTTLYLSFPPLHPEYL